MSNKYRSYQDFFLAVKALQVHTFSQIKIINTLIENISDENIEDLSKLALKIVEDVKGQETSQYLDLIRLIGSTKESGMGSC